jgi:endonuclease III
MKLQDKAARIQRILDELIPETPIPLQHRDPFTLLIAVLLSAQCTDARVNKTTPSLFAKARTPEEMLRLSVPQIRAIIRPCGLSPQKAKAIRGLSEMLVQEHDGEVPRDLAALEQLPGVGHKTASVVAAHAFGIPTFPVDTHIHRLATRWGLTSGRNVVQTERDLKRLFPESAWERLHLQLIWFGRRYCPALRHDHASCPICSWAMSRQRLREERARRRGTTRAGAATSRHASASAQPSRTRRRAPRRSGRRSENAGRRRDRA